MVTMAVIMEEMKKKMKMEKKLIQVENFDDLILIIYKKIGIKMKKKTKIKKKIKTKRIMKITMKTIIIIILILILILMVEKIEVKQHIIRRKI